VKASLDNVAGVRIPKFEKVGEGHDTNMALTGLGSGGKAIQVSIMYPVHGFEPFDEHVMWLQSRSTCCRPSTGKEGRRARSTFKTWRDDAVFSFADPIGDGLAADRALQPVVIRIDHSQDYVPWLLRPGTQ